MIAALKIDEDSLLTDMLAGKFPDARGRFGPFGGRYVPETLVPALDRLQAGVDRYLPRRGFPQRIPLRAQDMGRPPHTADARARALQPLGRAGVAEA